MRAGESMDIGAKKAFADKERWSATGLSGFFQLSVITFLFMLLPGCAPKVQVLYLPQQKRISTAETSAAGKENVLLLKRHYEQWRGTPYVDGGMSATGIDCSGFTALAYRDVFSLALPRTAGEQAESGQEIARASLKSGDLVFFNTGRSKKHVGIYLTDDQFIHASVSKGVTLSSLDDTYWQERYWQARRVHAPVGTDRSNNTTVAMYRR
jgi:hypothetical protein